jgi:hypothetical protein
LRDLLIVVAALVLAVLTVADIAPALMDQGALDHVAGPGRNDSIWIQALAAADVSLAESFLASLAPALARRQQIALACHRVRCIGSTEPRLTDGGLHASSLV